MNIDTENLPDDAKELQTLIVNLIETHQSNESRIKLLEEQLRLLHNPA